MSEGADTLTISVYNPAANSYRIVKATGFSRFIDGKKLAREYKRQEMLAFYDESKMQLQDVKTGRVFSFTLGKKELLFGSAIYQKIK